MNFRKQELARSTSSQWGGKIEPNLNPYNMPMTSESLEISTNKQTVDTYGAEDKVRICKENNILSAESQ